MRLSTVIGALGAVWLASASAWAADLRLITIDAAPWASIDDNQDAVGAFPDIVAEMERRTGHRIAVSVHPFARIDRELETGSQDCTIILWNEARSRIVDRGEDVYLMTFGVIAAKGVKLASYDDLYPLTISVVRNLAIEPRFDGDPALRKDFDKNYALGLQKIAHRRLDAIAGALPTINYQAKVDGLTDVLGDTLVMTRIPLALQCSRKSPNPGVLDELNQVIRQMKADGTLTHILARHDYH
jgi:polar amino acid transport system substrate-binding protein